MKGRGDVKERAKDSNMKGGVKTTVREGDVKG